MNGGRKDSKKEIVEARTEIMAKLMLVSEKDIQEDCLLYGVLKKSFIERILWLEDQTKPTLDYIIVQCEACNKCNFKAMPSKM
ncbi:MAG: hypothetical protein LBD60_00030 [Puniceicoccales bacterium]|jgi:hypothetical protein|nr:hypothetical protein [Puniceicoccales bacterium]